MKHIAFDTAFWKQLAIQLIVASWMVVLFCWNADSADITELKSAIVGGIGIVTAHFGMAYLRPRFDSVKQQQPKTRTSGM